MADSQESEQEGGQESGALPPALDGDLQDTYLESRDPAELVFCIILSAAYAGLAKWSWEGLQPTGQWSLLFNIAGFFTTISLLSLALGFRPYFSPCNLQISTHGIKYRGPHWPRRKTVNWTQMYKLYISPSLIVVLYHPPHKPKGVRFLVIQTGYLADRPRIVESFIKYTRIEPLFFASPDWSTKLILLLLYGFVVGWILLMIMSG